MGSRLCSCEDESIKERHPDCRMRPRTVRRCSKSNWGLQGWQTRARCEAPRRVVLLHDRVRQGTLVRLLLLRVHTDGAHTDTPRYLHVVHSEVTVGLGAPVSAVTASAEVTSVYTSPQPILDTRHTLAPVRACATPDSTRVSTGCNA